MQLQVIQIQAIRDFRDFAGFRIHENADFGHRVWNRRHHLFGCGQIDAARALVVEVQPDRIGTRQRCKSGALHGRDAANLYLKQGYDP